MKCKWWMDQYIRERQVVGDVRCQRGDSWSGLIRSTLGRGALIIADQTDDGCDGLHTRGGGNRDVMRRKRRNNDQREKKSKELIKQGTGKKRKKQYPGLIIRQLISSTLGGRALIIGDQMDDGCDAQVRTAGYIQGVEEIEMWEGKELTMLREERRWN